MTDGQSSKGFPPGHADPQGLRSAWSDAAGAARVSALFRGAFAADPDGAASLALLACLHPLTTQSAELVGVAQAGIEF